MALTPAQRDTIIRTIAGEALNQGPPGWAAVGNVLFNRAKDVRWGSGDPAAEAKRPGANGTYQFSAWNAKGQGGNNIPKSIKPDMLVYKEIGIVVDMLDKGALPDFTKGAVYYYAPKGMKDGGVPSWAKSEPETTKVGDHIFFGKVDTGRPEEDRDTRVGNEKPSKPAAVTAANMPIPRANPRMEEANQRVADAERVASETAVVARYNPSASAFVPTQHASPELTTALGYTYGDRTDRPSGAAAAIAAIPTGTEGVRERTPTGSPISVTPSASALDWNDTSLQRTSMGAPDQPAYNPLSSARTTQPAAPVATPTPTPATPPPQPVGTTNQSASALTQPHYDPLSSAVTGQPAFNPLDSASPNVLPPPYDPLSSINAPVQPAYDPLSSVQAPTPVPGTGPVAPPVTKQPGAPATGSARKTTPAAAAPAIRKPSTPVKATVPNARPIHPDVQPLVMRSITGISGPGPFNKATVQHYLSQQQWHAPNFDAKAGGSTYPYFTDHASGIGGYVTSTGKAYTYSLRANPGQSSTGMTGDEARAAAYTAGGGR